MRPASQIFLALILLLSTACNQHPSGVAPEKDDGMLKAIQATLLTGELRCLRAPPSEAQIKYLFDARPAQAQRYIVALAENGDEAKCIVASLRACEQVSPGECAAP